MEYESEVKSPVFNVRISLRDLASFVLHWESLGREPIYTASEIVNLALKGHNNYFIKDQKMHVPTTEDALHVLQSRRIKIPKTRAMKGVVRQLQAEALAEPGSEEWKYPLEQPTKQAKGSTLGEGPSDEEFAERERIKSEALKAALESGMIKEPKNDDSDTGE